MANEIEDTFDKLKAGAKAVAKKITDPDKDLGEEYGKEKNKETSVEVERTVESQTEDSINETIDTEAEGSITKDPMSPEKIAAHEPTAVKRELNQGSGGDPLTKSNKEFSGSQVNVENKSPDFGNKSDESTMGISSTYSCEECGKSFGSRQELKEHTVEH
ncbi:MAG TPA: C2H2-type zinc finger protein [Nitrososphaeraceae archaeon]